MKDFTREKTEFWGNFTSELTQEINEKQLLSSYIAKISLSKNKEDGHSFAQSYVDYLVSEVLPKCETLKKYGFTVEDSIKEREHGDFYLVNNSEGIKYIVSSNGKLGMSEELGQPNMCSIERAMKYLNEKNLPYLVFKLRKFKGNFIFKVFDLFNYLDVVSYNDGPGQLMISESKFFKKKEFKYLKTSEAIVYLSNMNEKAYNNLFISRTKRYNEFQNIKKQYERNEV
jgi:hypothetical protein